MKQLQLNKKIIFGCCVLGSIVLSQVGFVAAEGSEDLGVLQGLDHKGQVKVHVKEVGERIRVCTSDNWLQEQDVEYLGNIYRIDSIPGRGHVHDLGNNDPAYLLMDERREREIYVLPPGFRQPCANFGDCDFDNNIWCVDWATGRFGSVDNPNPEQQFCTQAFNVQTNRKGFPGEPNNAGNHEDFDDFGYCNAQPGTIPTWYEIVPDQTGVWTFDFMGEAESRARNGNLSTRYFDVQVLSAADATPISGRLFETKWWLHAHTLDNFTSETLYVVASRQDGTRIFAIEFSDFRGIHYAFSSNQEGALQDVPASLCKVHPVGDNLDCIHEAEVEFREGMGQQILTHELIEEHEIYVNVPDVDVELAELPEVSEVVFNNGVGDPQLVRNGEDEEQQGEFQFHTNMDGVFHLIIDTDRDGVLNPRLDFVTSQALAAGDHVIPWEGMDREGNALPDGDYRFSMELRSDEATHLVFDDAENTHIIDEELANNNRDNETGFTVWEVRGPNRQDWLPVRMHWDDSQVRNEMDLVYSADQVVTSDVGSFVFSDEEGIAQNRVWNQEVRPLEYDFNGDGELDDIVEIPVLFNTWFHSGVRPKRELGCDNCGDQLQGHISILTRQVEEPVGGMGGEPMGGMPEAGGEPVGGMGGEPMGGMPEAGGEPVGGMGGMPEAGGELAGGQGGEPASGGMGGMPEAGGEPVGGQGGEPAAGGMGGMPEAGGELVGGMGGEPVAGEMNQNTGGEGNLSMGIDEPLSRRKKGCKKCSASESEGMTFSHLLAFIVPCWLLIRARERKSFRQ